MERLSPLHRLMARMVAFESATNRELADRTDLSYVHVSRIVNDPLFQEEVNTLRNTLDERIMAQRNDALRPVYDDIANLLQDAMEIAHDTDAKRSDRLKAIDMLSSYVIRKKGEDKEKDDEASTLMVQLKDSDKYQHDADVNPAANPNIIDIVEGARNGTDDV